MHWSHFWQFYWLTSAKNPLKHIFYSWFMFAPTFYWVMDDAELEPKSFKMLVEFSTFIDFDKFKNMLGRRFGNFLGLRPSFCTQRTYSAGTEPRIYDQ